MRSLSAELTTAQGTLAGSSTDSWNNIITQHARRHPARIQHLPPQIGSPRSQRRSVYRGAIIPPFPSTSSGLSHTPGRQVLPRARWECRTSGQRRLRYRLQELIHAYATRCCSRGFSTTRGYAAAGTSNTRGNSWPAMASPRSPLFHDLSR